MSSERGIFLVLFFGLIFNESNACFRSDKHEILSITTGSTFYKECQCSEDGFSIDSLQWLDNNGEPIPPLVLGYGTRPKMFTEKEYEYSSLYLHIPSITKAMSGTYKCVTQVNGKTYTESYTIAAYEPLYFYKTPSKQHLVYGRSSLIMCQPRSDSTVFIQWQKEKEELIEISNSEKYSVAIDGLLIHNVTKNDAGVYKCTARVIATNEEVDTYIEVKVMTEPEIKRIKANPDNYDPTTVVAGETLSIECIADGFPHPEYYWNKTSDVSDPISDISWRQEINTIIFDEIKPEDSGVYTCYAYNLAGTSMRNISVEVLIPPYITNFPNITAVESSTIQIICNATGEPEPSIAITYEGRNLNGDSNEEIPEESEYFPNLGFMTVDRLHEGIYVCNATNKVGFVYTVMYLTVLHRPYFEMNEESIWGWEGKTTHFNCNQDSNPPAVITWRFHGNNILTDEEVEMNKKLLSTLNNMPEPYFTLTIDNETSYGIYECTAKNMYGEATKRITLVQGFKPGSVQNISVDEPTATSITFHIEGPDHVDGPPVIGFTATYDEEKNYNITDIHINRTWAIGRPFKLDKLKPNTTYLVRFAALNEVGPGPWTDYIEFDTIDKSVPEPPVWDEEPIRLEINGHVLTWRAPDDNGEPIEYYTLRYCPEEDDESCKTKRIAPTTELELEDLEFNNTYFLELVAHNAVGDSIAANVSIIVPAPLLNLPTTQLSGGAIIGISIVIVVLCLLLLDVLLLVWRRQGIIATCCFKKDNKRKENVLNSRDKKGLLTNGESEDRAGSVPNNGHKEFQYNKNTGVVTGKHSAV